MKRADRVKVTHTVVDFVGNVEMPVWNDENKQPVEGHARSNCDSSSATICISG
jgi:hypothetical protein